MAAASEPKATTTMIDCSTDTIRPYLTVRPVPERLRPCVMWREPGSVLVAVHPGTDRAVAAQYLVDHCSVEEQNAYRNALAQGAIGTPLDDWCLTGPMFTVVPTLRLDAERDLYLDEPTWPADVMSG